MRGGLLEWRILGLPGESERLSLAPRGFLVVSAIHWWSRGASLAGLAFGVALSRRRLGAPRSAW
jgi:hypothetical protein